MPLPTRLQSILTQNAGIITTAQANSVGVSNERLRLFVKAGELDRASFGLYTSPDEFADRMYAAQLRRKKIIYSCETALFLHGLCDHDSTSFSVTVPTGYNSDKLWEEGFTVYTIKRELHEIGMTQLTTVYGNSIAAYNLERTICDCLRTRNQMDNALVTEAVKRYAKHEEKNLDALIQMATVLKVNKPLSRCMDMLS